MTLNCKNHIRLGELQRVTEWHVDYLISEHGLRLVAIDVVPTRGYGQASGGGSDKREPVELVITLRKP